MDSDHDSETTPLRHWVKDYDSWLAEAVGVELKATLKTRKLLILLNEKNAKNTGFAQVRYKTEEWHTQSSILLKLLFIYCLL